MALFNFFNKKQQAQGEVITVKAEADNFMSFSMNYDTSVELQSNYKGANGYLYGADGLFPQELNRLFEQSPLHSAILRFKKNQSCGKGLQALNTALSMNDQISLNQLLSQFECFKKVVFDDYFIHSRICLLITWGGEPGTDNTKIIKVERIAAEKIHINDVNERMEPINFLYNWDWSNYSMFKIITYQKFDQANRKNKQQLFFFQVESPGMKLYSEPQYKSALPWVFLDSEMAVYHKSNIINSLNPSLFIQFYENPDTEEKKQKVKTGLQHTFGGARKAGKVMVHFNDGVETAPKLTQLEPNKLDRTFVSLTDTIQRQICYAHNIDPQILGLKTPGSLGNSSNPEFAYKTFNSAIIQPAQEDVESILNKLISINGIQTKVKFIESDLFSGTQAATPGSGNGNGYDVSQKAAEPVQMQAMSQQINDIESLLQDFINKTNRK